MAGSQLGYDVAQEVIANDLRTVAA
jgi:hypothetical protein